MMLAVTMLFCGQIITLLFDGFSYTTEIYEINYPHMGLMVDSYLLPTSKSRDTKTRTKIKIRPQ